MRRSLFIVLAISCLLAACGRSGPESRRHGFLVVAAENTWGSLASQLAGDRATVVSIVANPATDPHDYQPSAADARAISASSVAIVNGLGYDDWAGQLLGASPSSRRTVLDVGRLLRLQEGANPHRWYYPADVVRVIDAIARAFERIDPADAPYFQARRRWLLGSALAEYDRLRREIRARFAGTPVGYSESIFQGLGEDLGLRLLTPVSFAKAVAEGTDVTAQDKRTVDAQVTAHRIDVWVFNSQNATPDVQRVNDLAHTAGIPIATVTETLSPASASFERWQSDQLRALLATLERVRR
jgi:zinc/manganese transport system substrate-binding protein